MIIVARVFRIRGNDCQRLGYAMARNLKMKWQVIAVRIKTLAFLFSNVIFVGQNLENPEMW